MRLAGLGSFGLPSPCTLACQFPAMYGLVAGANSVTKPGSPEAQKKRLAVRVTSQASACTRVSIWVCAKTSSCSPFRKFGQS